MEGNYHRGVEDHVSRHFGRRNGHPKGQYVLRCRRGCVSPLLVQRLVDRGRGMPETTLIRVAAPSPRRLGMDGRCSNKHSNQRFRQISEISIYIRSGGGCFRAAHHI